MFKVFLFFFCQINIITRAENEFWRNITILYSIYSKFTTFSDFKKFKIFFEKPISFFLKKAPKFERSEKFYYLSRILRQIWQFDEKKIDIQTREQPTLARLRELNWQTSGKKPTYLRRFCFHILKIMAQNNNNYADWNWRISFPRQWN